jgi:branched-chain amino acid transport system ATP-binding protein
MSGLGRTSIPLFEVSSPRVTYGNALAIESFSIEVEKVELVGVLGPNGVGEPTLPRAISPS